MVTPLQLADTAPACVLDVRLSLGPGGLYWVLGLARTLPVWLVETHWAIVDDPFRLGQEALVRRLAAAPGASDEMCAAAMRGRCNDWRCAQRAWRLEGHANLFWPADRLAESVVPKDGDAGLIGRRDALATGLDHRCGRAAETVDTAADCTRDALALAAALGATPAGATAFVLTTLAEAEEQPALAETLAAAGVPCRRLEGGWAARYDELLAPALLRAGLATALAAGCLRLAGLQVVTPMALGPRPIDTPVGDAELAWNAAALGDEAKLWQDAAAACWEVRCAG
jgi:hypothetical protein